MNNVFSLKAFSKYLDRFGVITFLQSHFSAIVPYITVAFAPGHKISYKALRSVVFETGRVYVGNHMSQKLTLVLMAGLPSAGKSTIASALSNELQWYVVDKDKYRKELLRWGFDEDQASYNAYEVAFAIAQYKLAQKRASVILDCVGLHDFILENVMNIVRSVENVQLKVILCVVDRGLRQERFSKRSPQRVVINDDLETDADYFKVYKKLPPEEDTCVLHTDEPLRACLDKAQKYLGVVNDCTATSVAKEECFDEAGDHLGKIEYALGRT
jgi:predicted kinase